MVDPEIESVDSLVHSVILHKKLITYEDWKDLSVNSLKIFKNYVDSDVSNNVVFYTVYSDDFKSDLSDVVLDDYINDSLSSDLNASNVIDPFFDDNIKDFSYFDLFHSNGIVGIDEEISKLVSEKDFMDSYSVNWALSSSKNGVDYFISSSYRLKDRDNLGFLVIGENSLLKSLKDVWSSLGYDSREI